MSTKNTSRGAIPLIVVILLVLVGVGLWLLSSQEKLSLLPPYSPLRSPAPVTSPTVSLVKISKSFNPKDEYTLNNIRIEKDTLHLNISYGGGCKEHVFDLIWNGRYLESYPPQVDLFLTHDAGGDYCEAYITQDLQFNLSPIKKGALKLYQSDEVIINFYDYEKERHRLNYKLP